MTDSLQSSSSEHPGGSTEAIIHFLLKRKWKYFVIVAITGIVSALVIKFEILDYSASSSFYVNDMQVLSSSQVDLKSLESLSPADNFGRIYQQVNSTEMLVHLIRKFDLCRHYGIDTTQEFYFQKTISILSKKISVSKTPFSTIIISVSDKYRYFAPEIANEMLAYLNVMNKRFYVSNLEKKLSISQAFLAQMKQDNEQKSQSLDSLVRQMRGLIGSSSERTLPFWLEEQDKLASIVSKIDNSTNELINSQRLYNLALQAMAQKDFPAITVVMKAMPESRSNAFKAILLSMVLCLALCSVIILQAYFRLEYSNYWKLIFKAEAEKSKDN